MALDPLVSLAQHRAARNGTGGHMVRFTDDKPPKLVLPDIPEHDDLPGLCAWLTGVLRLNPQHPVSGAARYGISGPDGHAEIRRAGAAPIRFEPVAVIYAARRMLPMLDTQLLPTDGEPYGFKDEHCRRIARVMLLLAGATESSTGEQEAGGIVGTFLSGAVPVEAHTTHGTTAQRYSAARALQREADEHTGRPVGPVRYLIDSNTGELVIRVSDLQRAGREHVGSTLPRGWLDARMDLIGWQRCRLDGHALPGRDGRSGPHLRMDVYRGHLAVDGDGDESVTT